MNDKSIGEQIREERIKQNITLKELSEKTNLSTGFLSQFERGYTTIAVDSLGKISKVLSLELADFFEPNTQNTEEDNSDSVILKSFEQSLTNFVGENFIMKSLTKNGKNMKFHPRLITILPSRTKENVIDYNHEGEEFIYVLEGVLKFSYNGKQTYLYPGDSAQYKSTVDHNWYNDTSKTVKFICITYPNPIKQYH
ncbi:MAG: helix-turn-helix domain-containing protein [Anaerococcus sp.]